MQLERESNHRLMKRDGLWTILSEARPRGYSDYEANYSQNSIRHTLIQGYSSPHFPSFSVVNVPLPPWLSCLCVWRADPFQHLTLPGTPNTLQTLPVLIIQPCTTWDVGLKHLQKEQHPENGQSLWAAFLPVSRETSRALLVIKFPL